ncbi:Protein kinase-like domain-containing protein [Strongyloides ratti]|uniref:Protein kinase-like domain-containing protein n=1 Tax=Strongyloides ratti TaxID=34506 RepID=A0A090MZ64_STRRB|nr:Protein kinase-like domain-containing protein [Strongyloides ratti]CEF68389.1 Protein kinase-like domain-containing protein [Strongyloides ratti]
MENEINYINFDGSFNLKNLTNLLEKYLSRKYTIKNSWKYEKINGGYSNTLIKATNISTNETFVVRLFGSCMSSYHIINKTNLISMYLGENKMGPKLYGVFSKGTIEEFLPGRNLTREELHLPEMTEKIGYYMGKIHKFELPFIKISTFWDDVQSWLYKLKVAEEEILKQYEIFKNDWTNEKLCEKLGFKVERINKYENTYLKIYIKQTLFPPSETIPKTTSIKELYEEYNSILSKINNSKSPVVFCHNDLHEGNILYNEDKNTILPIDYEYSCYNNRGFDFAQTLNHYAWEYGSSNEYGYNIFPNEYPTQQQLENFFRNYIKASNTKSSIEELINESTLFLEIPHFVWFIWGLEKHFSSLGDEKKDFSYIFPSFDSQKSRKFSTGFYTSENNNVISMKIINLEHLLNSNQMKLVPSL